MFKLNWVFHLFIFRVHKGPNPIADVVKNKIIQVVEQRNLMKNSDCIDKIDIEG